MLKSEFWNFCNLELSGIWHFSVNYYLYLWRLVFGIYFSWTVNSYYYKRVLLYWFYWGRLLYRNHGRLAWDVYLKPIHPHTTPFTDTLYRNHGRLVWDVYLKPIHHHTTRFTDTLYRNHGRLVWDVPLKPIHPHTTPFTVTLYRNHGRLAWDVHLKPIHPHATTFTLTLYRNHGRLVWDVPLKPIHPHTTPFTLTLYRNHGRLAWVVLLSLKFENILVELFCRSFQICSFFTLIKTPQKPCGNLVKQYCVFIVFAWIFRMLCVCSQMQLPPN